MLARRFVSIFRGNRSGAGVCQTGTAVIRLRRYRSPGLLILALGISITAQGAAVVGYTLTRPVPKPTLTIHLGDAATSWDYEISDHPADAATVRVDGPKGFKLTLT